MSKYLFRGNRCKTSMVSQWSQNRLKKQRTTSKTYVIWSPYISHGSSHVTLSFLLSQQCSYSPQGALLACTVSYSELLFPFFFLCLINFYTSFYIPILASFSEKTSQAKFPIPHQITSGLLMLYF